MVNDKPITIQTQHYEDFRGWLSVPVDRSLDFDVIQINQGFSRKAYTLRGLHFQEEPYAQAKLVSCLHGAIFFPLKITSRCSFREDLPTDI